MTQVPRHRHNVILNVTQVQPDLTPRRYLPLLVTSLGEALDDIRLCAQQSIQAHDFLAAFANVAQHVAVALSRKDVDDFADFVTGEVIGSGLKLFGTIRLRGLVGSSVHIEDRLINAVDFFFDFFNERRISVSDVVDNSV
jgi:hypothetical protein